MRASARTPQQTTTLQDVDVECTHCGVRMSQHTGSGSVRYFHCPTCHRWVTSMYTEVFKADAKVRTRAPVPEGPTPFDRVKDRLERWLASLDSQDPYKVLGVSPMDSDARIREAYRELAIANHPDRGGSADKMREINSAYERVYQHREQKKLERLEAGNVRPGAELGSGVV